MKHLSLQGADNLSDIYIQDGLLSMVSQLCNTRFSPARIHIVTDTHVAPLYLEQVKSQFSHPVTHTIIPAGEENKNLATVSGIYEDFCQAGLTRQDLIIALGGGVVGDITGFAASSYLRGVPLCQIPTTLLAQVDSSVGGKCGVDLPQGKNLVGAFYQPSLVIIDPEALNTLSDRIFHDGMSEVIKYGCIANEEILHMIDKPDFRENIGDVIYECVKIKRDVVSQDEHDTGLRMILNFGHTIGHAAEKLGNYRDLTHGQAVAIGMVAATKLSYALGKSEADLTPALIQILKKHDLPTRLEYPLTDICQAMLSDKKKVADSIRFVFLTAFGACLAEKIATEDLFTQMDRILGKEG